MLDTCIFDRTGSSGKDVTEKRHIQINYPGSGNYSQFAYDGFSHIVSIVESTSGTVSSTRQFVWSGGDMKEARSASGAITAQYFGKGQTINGSAYFYTKDRLASVREMTDTSGNVQSQYEYDPFGRVTKLQGNLTSDLQYAGYYCHLQSSLNLAVFRAYSSNLGRWINRDPISERGGINLYRYTKNDPIDISDPAGTAPAQVDPTIPRSPSDVSLPCPNGGENCGGLPGDPNRPDPNNQGYYLAIVPKNCFQDSVGKNHSVYFRTSNGYTYIYQPGSGPPLNTYPCTWCSNPPDTN